MTLKDLEELNLIYFLIDNNIYYIYNNIGESDDIIFIPPTITYCGELEYDSKRGVMKYLNTNKIVNSSEELKQEILKWINKLEFHPDIYNPHISEYHRTKLKFESKLKNICDSVYINTNYSLDNQDCIVYEIPLTPKLEQNSVIQIGMTPQDECVDIWITGIKGIPPIYVDNCPLDKAIDYIEEFIVASVMPIFVDCFKLLNNVNKFDLSELSKLKVDKSTFDTCIKILNAVNKFNSSESGKLKADKVSMDIDKIEQKLLYEKI